MWYAMLDAQRRLIRAMAHGVLQGRGDNGCDALAGWMKGGDALPALRGWLCRSTCSLDRAPSFSIDSVCASARVVPVRETIADEVPAGALRKFTRAGTAARRSGSWPVVLCAPLAGHHAVMLREMVEALLAHREVYVTDWTDARDIPAEAGALTLDDYVLATERFIRFVSSPGTRVHVIAVCQATVPALAAAALLACEPASPLASLALLGGPIDAGLNPTAVERFAMSHSLSWFGEHVIDTVPPPYRGRGRRVYPGYLQQAAIVAAYPGRLIGLETRYWSAWLAGNTREAQAALRALNEYAAVLDMTEQYFLDTIRVVFHERRLACGEWTIATRPVETRALARVALCTVEGDRDDITGAGQTHCAHALCAADDAPPRHRLTVAQCDHYDLFTGPRWHETVHPRLCAFWHETERVWRSARDKRSVTGMPA